MPNVIGIDVSSAQHPNGAQINYAAAVADLRQRSGGLTPFVLVKLTEGVTYVNPYAAADVAGFKESGANVLGYHFIHAAIPAASQIAYINENRMGVEKVFADAESQGFDGQALTTVSEVSQAVVDTFDGLYSNVSTFGQLSGAPWGKAMWLADPSGVGQNIPRLITQTGQSGVAGIIGPVDMDMADSEALTTFLTPPTPEPTPVPVEITPPTPPAPPALTTGQALAKQLPTVVIGFANSLTVRRVQALLCANGHSLAIDGSFGGITLAMVKAFQSQVGISVDGIVGPITWAKLIGDCPTLSQGATGLDVKRMQQLLTANGHLTAGDGDFGPVSSAQLRAFQSQVGITVDGICGPITWAHLFGIS